MFSEMKQVFAYSRFTLGNDCYYTVYRNGVFRIMLDQETPKEIFCGSFKDCEKHQEQMKSDYIKSKLGREQENVYR